MKKGKRTKRRWGKESIQALRRHLGYTQNEMAEMLGTRQQTISEWETGRYQPRGASATLLSMVAERASFTYDASPVSEKENKARARLAGKSDLNTLETC